MVEKNTPAAETGDTDSGAEESRISDESKNTGQDKFDKGVDVGFAKGAKKAKREVFDALGTEDVDAIKSALEFQSEFEEKNKSAAERLDGLKNENKDLKKALKTFQERDKVEAEGVFEKLSETQQVSIKEAGLPLEKMVPVMLQMIDSESRTSKQVGTPVSPHTPDEDSPDRIVPLKQFGANPEYLKDKNSYIAKKVAEINRRHEND